MTMTLSAPVAALLDAHNCHDPAAFIACVTEDATVRDEGRAHHGRAAIRAWFEDVSRRYRPVLDVTSVAEIDGETVLTGHVSGGFAGGPIGFRYVVATEDDLVVALRIRPVLPS